MFSVYDLKQFGLELKTIRVKCGLTQKEVRDKTGIHEDTLRKIESGKVIPRYDTIEILSTVYCRDLLSMLITLRKHPQLDLIYKKLDQSLLFNKIEHIKALKDEFESKIYNDSLLINKKVYDQLILFITLTIKYHQKSVTNEMITQLSDYLNIHENFNIQLANNFNLLEIRLFLLLSLFLMDTENYSLSLRYLCWINDYLSSELYITEEIIKMRIKIFLNLSYNSFMMDDHQQSLKFARAGIEYATKHQQFYCLAPLLARKAVSQIKLNDNGYIDSFKKCIHILEILGDEDLISTYYEVTLQRYNIDLFQIR